MPYKIIVPFNFKQNKNCYEKDHQSPACGLGRQEIRRKNRMWMLRYYYRFYNSLVVAFQPGNLMTFDY